MPQFQPIHSASAILGATPKVQGSRDVFCDSFNQKPAGTAACILQVHREPGSTPGEKVECMHQVLHMVLFIFCSKKAPYPQT